MKGWRIVTVLLLCLALLSSTSCNLSGEKEQEVTEQLVEVERGDLTVTVSGSGNINVSKDARLTFGSGGRVDKIYVKEGDEVSEGEVLAKLETDALELALAQAQVAQQQSRLAVAQARVALDQVDYNLSRLRKSTFVTAEEISIAEMQLEAADLQLELATSQFELAKQSLALAQKQLDAATITAPFDGIIASVSANEKDAVSAAIPIVYLIDPGSMELKVQVDEIDITEVKPEQSAIIEIDALPAITLEGKVSSISLLPTQASGVIVYDVTINFDISRVTGLRDGMSATADIIIAERNNVLLVPDRAIKQDSQGNSIVEVMANGQIEERAVIIGVSDGFQTEIVGGLTEGETVVERRTESKSSIPALFR